MLNSALALKLKKKTMQGVKRNPYLIPRLCNCRFVFGVFRGKIVTLTKNIQINIRLVPKLTKSTENVDYVFCYLFAQICLKRRDFRGWSALNRATCRYIHTPCPSNP